MPQATTRSSQPAVVDPGPGADTRTEVDPMRVPRSIARVLDLFEIVLAERGCNLTTAAHASGLTPTTALRYLRALEARGYVDRDPSGDFSAGPTILRIAAALRGGGLLDRLAAAAQPHLDHLAEQTGESAYVAVSDGRTGTYIAAAESTRAIRHVGWVGQQVPLDGSALGAALDQPGNIAIRTGAVESDITAMSLALGSPGKLGVALSIVAPTYRLGAIEQTAHSSRLTEAVHRLERDLRTTGEDLAS